MNIDYTLKDIFFIFLTKMSTTLANKAAICVETLLTSAVCADFESSLIDLDVRLILTLEHVYQGNKV